MTSADYKLAAANWLKRQRTLLNLTQAEVASAVGASVGSVSHWERGLHGMSARDEKSLRGFFRVKWAEREPQVEGGADVQ